MKPKQNTKRDISPFAAALRAWLLTRVGCWTDCEAARLLGCNRATVLRRRRWIDDWFRRHLATVASQRRAVRPASTMRPDGRSAK